jgi:hypothetical protein
MYSAEEIRKRNATAKKARAKTAKKKRITRKSRKTASPASA